jgi:tetratricopeptide (TPR) repeat protein
VSAGRGLALAAVLCLASVAPATADTPPSSWTRARDPAAGDRWALHVRVQRLLYSESLDVGPLDVKHNEELRLEIARSLLEEVDTAHSPDPRLRFDLGIVYDRLSAIRKTNDLSQKAVDVLAPALAQAPDGEGSTEGLEALAASYDRLERVKEEIATTRLFIPRLLRESSRALWLMNLGEAQMHLGHLTDAMASFQEALAISKPLNLNLSIALTLWDVAVALDRSGDTGQALATAKEAAEWNWIDVRGSGSLQTARALTGWDAIQDEEDVYFVPDWEREWYLALGTAVAGRAATNARASAALWSQCEAHWKEYVRHAETATPPDRWLAIARVRLEHAHDERLAAERRAAKLPPPPRPDVGTWSDP